MPGELSLGKILKLVGHLDDQPGENAPRERFRLFLRDEVTSVGQLRDYIEECLRTPGDQSSRALQDLINRLGMFLGFDVTFGRYQGAPGQPGFDGLWRSPTGWHLVIEVKTSQVYAIKTATLVSYIGDLVSARQVPSWEKVMGLYVIGRPDPEVRQLEHAILAEKHAYPLRVISADSLISLAELMSEFDVGHEDLLAVLLPSGPSLDPVVGLIARLMARAKGGRQPEDLATEPTPPEEVPTELSEVGVSYWLVPSSGEEDVLKLVGQDKVWAFGERTPGRARVKPGDWVCFYVVTKGVIAHARFASKPERKPHPGVTKEYPWLVQLADVKLYPDAPVVIDAALRAQLDAFKGRDPGGSWSWFVQTTRRLSEHDFKLLTRSP